MRGTDNPCVRISVEERVGCRGAIDFISDVKMGLNVLVIGSHLDIIKIIINLTNSMNSIQMLIIFPHSAE